MKRYSWTTTVAATICMLVASVSVAEQSTGQNQADKGDHAEKQNRDANEQGRLSEALKQLDLTSEQQEQIRSTNQEFTPKIQKAWRNFHQSHMNAVTLEATWQAAVRDTLSEEDHKKYDKQRMQNKSHADHKSSAQAEKRESNKSANTDQDKRAANRSQQDSQRTSGFRPSDQSQDSEDLVVIMLTSPVAYTSGTQQTSEQKANCSEVCQDYQKELKTAWEKSYKFHNEMVKLEAQRLSEIESHLDDDQLRELKKKRESASSESASNDSDFDDKES